MFLKYTLTAVLLSIGCASFVRAQDTGAETDVKTYEIKGSDGALTFEGKVERREAETKFEYLIVQLKLKFDPPRSKDANGIREVAVKEIQLVAWKKPADGNSRPTGLGGDKKQTSVVLTEDSPTATLKQIKLALPKESVAKADHVRLGLTDGKQLWPITIKWDEQTVLPKPSNSGS